jgi:SAM-dependent methyltransferase
MRMPSPPANNMEPNRLKPTASSSAMAGGGSSTYPSSDLDISLDESVDGGAAAEQEVHRRLQNQSQQQEQNTAQWQQWQQWQQPPAFLAPEVAPQPNYDDDSDSAIGSLMGSDRGSLSESILAYRTINGRRYHAERGGAQHWAANDDAHAESAELHYHVINDYQGCLFQSPIEVGSITRVLDVGTGNGMWAIDFADFASNVEVIGTDISPIQPTWVPPNVRFDIEDFTQPWPYDDASFDMVHARLLYGSVPDWEHFYNEAYRVLKPGGWLEHLDCEPYLKSDSGLVPATSATNQWNAFYAEGGRKTGQTFDVVPDRIQDINFARLGMQDVVAKAWKMPVGGWPEDPQMRFIGSGIRQALDQDMEGYVTFIAQIVAGWSREDVQDYSVRLRRETGNYEWQLYYKHRLVYGRKPQ